MAETLGQTTDRSSGLYGLNRVVSSWLAANPGILERIRQRAARRKHVKKLKVMLYISLFFSLSVGFVFGSGAVDLHCGVSLPSTGPVAKRIALVDPLALYYPNPEFIENISRMAAHYGYHFDYYSPEVANLDFLTHLPEMGYKIVILRTHGAAGNPIITTAIPYSPTQRIGDQLFDRLGSVRVEGHEYFALMPEFVSNVMCGRFDGTIVLAMGCNSMGIRASLADAFVEKGAAAFVGWSSLVTISHTDPSFQALTSLLLRGVSMPDAIQIVYNTIGPDLDTGAHLSFVTR